VAAAALFGGVYFWGAIVLAVGSSLLAWGVGPSVAAAPPLRTLDLALIALLAAIGVQLLPLPAFLVSIISPHRLSYIRQASLGAGEPGVLPLTLDRLATIHGYLATLCACLAFWTARAVFARGGLRTFGTALAWAAVAFVLVAFAQSASSSNLVYGFWPPHDAGARPFGPFVNRNHAGTWSLLALFLCFGSLQWRRAAGSASRARNWRARLAQALDGRSLMLGLATLLLTVSVAAGASRSAMAGLAAAALFVAVAAPGQRHGGRASLWTAAIAISAMLAVIAYADLDRLLSRVDETRQLGLAQRLAIWRDTLAIVRDFPVAGVGAGNFANAMRVYQTGDRTYFWNEAHDQYLQVAAEGGLLFAIPVTVGLVAFCRAGWRASAAPGDHLGWMRIGAAASLVAVAVQSVWETGLTLPANAMLAAVAAAILIHSSRHTSDAPARD
jgi:O-antigen ligase